MSVSKLTQKFSKKKTPTKGLEAMELVFNFLWTETVVSLHNKNLALFICYLYFVSDYHYDTSLVNHYFFDGSNTFSITYSVFTIILYLFIILII